MKPLGGYLELQNEKGLDFYPDMLRLNTARNAFEYILKIRKYRSIFLPYFTCQVLMEPIRKLGISYQFYTINEHLDPVLDFELEPGACFLYTNYFGIKQDTVIGLSKKFKALIIDNSQAFFSEPIAGLDTFYSCRKFFGVPDGAYLYTECPTRLKLERDVSFDRFAHLIKSIDLGIEQGYANFQENEKKLSNNPIRRMSLLTERLLTGVDYKECRYRRNANFMYLHDFLLDYNDYVFDASFVNGPMSYPLLTTSTELRQKLLEKRIYVATYWPNVLEWTTPKMYENYLTRHLLALPIDHRYNHSDMKRMLNALKQLL
ncbi:hypothetical protein [Pedobacter sp. BAL39]|uniref:hypothetical protein n=1 Tax=Pedobacter sp. BAL39 TaxID=391596 RepID=UPI00031E6069|nr:hypothetical protein [Pedobacter sp. BAL39]